MEYVKIVVGVPEMSADDVRRALGEAGAGKVGNYACTSFSVKGTGRFLPLDGAKPAIGQVGKLEEVVEERIETVCLKSDVEKVIDAVKKVHPYEEVAIDIIPLLSDPSEISKNPYSK
jgi:hypothetical protein